jgi:hypothetical protein
MARFARHKSGKVIQFSGFARKLNHPLLFCERSEQKDAKTYLT